MCSKEMESSNSVGTNIAPAASREGADGHDSHLVSYCRQCGTVTRDVENVKGPRICSKCAVECRTWLTPADKSLILVHRGDKTCWMAESYAQVADALTGGRACGDDELCEVKPNPKNVQNGKTVTVPRTETTEWTPLRSVRAFPVMVLFRPVMAHTDHWAKAGFGVGAAIGVLVAIVSFFAQDSVRPTGQRPISELFEPKNISLADCCARNISSTNRRGDALGRHSIYGLSDRAF